LFSTYGRGYFLKLKISMFQVNWMKLTSETVLLDLFPITL
jgi:hypothetical protein